MHQLYIFIILYWLSWDLTGLAMVFNVIIWIWRTINFKIMKKPWNVPESSLLFVTSQVEMGHFSSIKTPWPGLRLLQDLPQKRIFFNLSFWESWITSELPLVGMNISCSGIRSCPGRSWGKTADRRLKSSLLDAFLGRRRPP